MADKAIKYRVNVYSDRTEWKNLNGLYHRVDGPALEYSDGFKAWYINGQRHREDGQLSNGLMVINLGG